MSGSKKRSKEFSCIVPRGFLKTYLLEMLSEGPIHGYAVMEKVEKITGFWKPSPGTIYPLLNSLVKEGYAEILSGSGRKKEYRLTKKGKRLHLQVRETRYLLNEKISGVLSKMTPATKKELKGFFKSAAKGSREGPMIFPMHKMFSILLKISKSPEKTIPASEILDDANCKLEKLLDEKGGRK
jgi:DNA-binding PadR family transcriptional regulator